MRSGYELPHVGGPTISTRLTATLIGALRSGEFAGETRLPAEDELAARYGVSRSVIRDVLGNLEREGFVERGRGIGTIINTDIVQMDNRLDLKFEYNHLVTARGQRPTVDHVRMHEEAADEDMAERLAIDVGARLIVCQKRVLASGTPVILSIDRVPVHIFGGENYRMFDWSRPVFDLLEECCGVTVDTDIACITPTNATAAVRGEMELPNGAALLMMDEVGYYRLKYPVLHTYAYYTDFFEFTMLRKKL